MPERLRLLLSPPAEPSKVDTGLRFTDVLFGFVIRELFLRLQHWSKLPWYVRWHLIVGTVVVLGSWIGFRRSVNRQGKAYEVKFFNLPLFRFIADQIMVILYFQVAVMTPVEGTSFPPARELARRTTLLVMWVFVLYAVWDGLGAWMSVAKELEAGSPRRVKYRQIEEGKITDDAQSVDTWGMAITMVALAVQVAIWAAADRVETEGSAVGSFVAAVVALLAYRFAKEVRSSWRST